MSAPIHLYQPSEALGRLQQTISQRAHPSITVEQIQAAWRARLERKRRRARILALSGLFLWLMAILAFAVMILPQTLFKFFPTYTDRLAQSLGETVEVEKSGFGDLIYQAEFAPEPMYVPPFDPELPEENWIKIDKIGVNTQIFEGEDWEEVLKNGVWRYGDFGEPEDRQLPTVLAAHRFGYIYWTNQFRRESSFFNLPRLDNGDRIEVIWNQRRYVYEIYEGYTDTRFRNLDGDLILFTCEVLNSERRIIRHARLVVPDSFTDSLADPV